MPRDVSGCVQVQLSSFRFWIQELTHRSGHFLSCYGFVEHETLTLPSRRELPFQFRESPIVLPNTHFFDSTIETIACHQLDPKKALYRTYPELNLLSKHVKEICTALGQF